MGIGRTVDPIERVRDCECGHKPVIAVGTHKFRVLCKHCGRATEPQQGCDNAVEMWNAGNLEQRYDNKLTWNEGR